MPQCVHLGRMAGADWLVNHLIGLLKDDFSSDSQSPMTTLYIYRKIEKPPFFRVSKLVNTAQYCEIFTLKPEENMFRFHRLKPKSRVTLNSVYFSFVGESFGD